jgi:hypothetical protein
VHARTHAHTWDQGLLFGLPIFQVEANCHFRNATFPLQQHAPRFPLTCMKVRLPLCLTKHYAMKAYGGVDVYIHVFLTSALVGCWSASRPGRFTLGERAPGTHWIGGWMGPRTGLDVQKKTLLTLPGLELRPLGLPAPTQSLYQLRYPGSSYEWTIKLQRVN